MRLIKPSHKVEFLFPLMLPLIEQAGRTCYKSEALINAASAAKFVDSIIRRGHESVIEHANITVRFICDRGVTHEIVRHRLCAYSQESTRYCNYKGGVTFIIPPWLNLPEGNHGIDLDFPPEEIDDAGLWLLHMGWSERIYIRLLKEDWSPQQARSVLPNSLKTELVMTANLREWRHVLTLRTAKAAHPQMRELMIPLLAEFKRRIPVVFDDINID